MKPTSRRGTTPVSKTLFAAGVAASMGAVSVWGTLLPAHAQTPSNINVIVDGRVVEFGDTGPLRSGGRILVPLRAVFEALGAKVAYDPNNATVTGTRGARQVQLGIGSTRASVDGQPTTLDVAAQAPGGRVMVPLRFVSEAFGAKVDRITGDAIHGQTIFISTGSIGGTPDQPPVINPPNTNPPVTNPPITNPPVANPPANGGNGNGGVNVPVEAGTVRATVVKADPAPPATLTARVNGKLQTFPVAQDALVYRRFTGPLREGVTPQFGGTQPAQLTQLAPGEEVRLKLDADGNATQIVVLASVGLVRAAFAQGGRIVLDDADDTVLTVGKGMRYVNAQGQNANTPDVTQGQELALFYSPGSGALYQISALPADIALARQLQGAVGNGGAGNAGGNNPNNNGANGAARIQLVSHNAKRPLKVGDTVTVTVRGTPGLRGVFDLSPRAQNLPLRETATPGVYTGTFTARVGDDALDAHVTARLTGADGVEERSQSEGTLTIDTVPPRIFGAAPADNTNLTGARPNVVVSADDVGGSGLSRAEASFTQGGNRIEAAATVAPDGTISIVPNDDLTGAVTLRVTAYDGAGNQSAATFRYNVQAGVGDITSVTHNANVQLNAGEVVTVLISATPNGRARFDVLTPDGRPIAQKVAMRETEPGSYRGTYTVGNDLQVNNLRIVGRFTNAGGTDSTLEATQPVRLKGATANVAQLSIDTPTEGDNVNSPLVVKGRAAPNALVEVTPRAEGTRTLAGIIGYAPYREESPAIQVRADAQGNWQTPAITLPRRPKRINGFKIVLSAVQRDAAGAPTDPVEVSVVTAG